MSARFARVRRDGRADLGSPRRSLGLLGEEAPARIVPIQVLRRARKGAAGALSRQAQNFTVRTRGPGSMTGVNLSRWRRPTCHLERPLDEPRSSSVPHHLGQRRAAPRSGTDPILSDPRTSPMRRLRPLAKMSRRGGIGCVSEGDRARGLWSAGGSEDATAGRAAPPKKPDCAPWMTRVTSRRKASRERSEPRRTLPSELQLAARACAGSSRSSP